MKQINSVVRLRQLVRHYYAATGAGTSKEHELKGKANGFVEALLMTTNMTKNQIEQIIEKEHLDFFGITREARLSTPDESKERWPQKNWDKFDEPAYRRRPLRAKKKTKNPKFKSIQKTVSKIPS